MRVENELSNRAQPAKKRMRRRVLKWLGGAAAAGIGGWYVTDTERATANRCRALLGDRVDRELDAAAQQVGLQILAFLRDVRAIHVDDVQTGIRSGGGAPPTGPALDILKAFVKSLENLPMGARQRSIASVVFVASIWPDRSLVAALHSLARLPAHIRYRTFENDAEVLTTFADHLEKQSDLATMIAEMRSETARLQCEKDAESVSMQACGARRGKSWLPTR